jgi:hypothetical protein
MDQHSKIQNNRQLLERASVAIVQKAHALVNQAIEKTLQDWKLGEIQSEDEAIDHKAGEAPETVSDLSTVFW